MLSGARSKQLFVLLLLRAMRDPTWVSHSTKLVAIRWPSVTVPSLSIFAVLRNE